MMKWLVPFVVTVLAGHAYADATAEARKHSEKFAKACEAGEIDNVLGLYADDAHVVWPGAGEEAQGKVAVEKLAKDFCDPKTELKLTLKSIDGISIDSDHIATVGHWEASSKGPDGKKGTAEVRTTEVLVKAGSGWKYIVDHASIGLPPPKAARETHKAPSKK
jgi:ketosteroid isomerase-like protein